MDEKELQLWEEQKAKPVGTIFHDECADGLRFIVIRGPASLCAYVGLPLDHPLSGWDYDLLPVSCHGGLTFALVGDGKAWPTGYYWYGWDYAHAGDATTYDYGIELSGTKWLVEDVVKDSQEALYNFKNLIGLSEAIARKYRPCANLSRG